MTKEEVQTIAFKMIANIGAAKYKAIDTFRKYKQNGDKESALKSLKAAEQELGKVGQEHLSIIQEEAKGNNVDFSMMILHAEDQYMTTQMMMEILTLLVG